MSKIHVLEVWGDLACFTRPEMKVERYSYDIITPSAARAIFDAIYWKKQANFYWQITKIEILKPIKRIALRRNEVKAKASRKLKPIDINEERTQRQTIALQDVRYRLHGFIKFREQNVALDEINAKNEQFIRRASKGQCYYQPYFGCREFPAYFALSMDENREPLLDLNTDLGFMVYDVFDLATQNLEKEKDKPTPPKISVFNAKIVNGVMLVPEYISAEVLKP